MLKSDLERYLSLHCDASSCRWMCKRDPDLWQRVVQATEFLHNPLPRQRVWHVVNDQYAIPTCPVSGKPTRWFENRYLTYISVSDSRKCEHLQNKKTATQRLNKENKTGRPRNLREQYKADVWRSTKRSWRKYKSLIEKSDRRGRAWHLDHMLSIEDGFLLGVPAEIIGHWRNLRIIEATENLRKNSKSVISIDDLLRLIQL